MRSISIYILGTIIFILVVLSFLGYQTIRKLISKSKYKRWIAYSYWTYSFLVVLIFTSLFIFPKTAATSINYKAYFLFNIILITDLLSKIILSLTYIVYFLFRKRHLTVLWMGSIVTICLVLTTIYGASFGRNYLSINEISVEYKNLPPSFDGTKIVHVSDIHLGSFYSNSRLILKASKAIREINPDYIFFTGDLVNNFASEIDPWKEELKKWQSKRGNYAILGNHDYGDYFHWEDSLSKAKNLSGIINGHEDIGFKLLRNSHVPLVSGNNSIFLIGVENWGHDPFPQYADLEMAMEGIPDGAFKILLTHDPAHWESKIMNKEKIDLSLSGHTHGMQFGIKPAGIELSPMFWIRKNWGGLYQAGKQYLFVNRGFGTIGINWRIDMPPEITVISLKRSKVD